MTGTRRVLSGVQPSGDLHLGNYFGAIKQHIALQDDPENDPYYFVANYHALTTVRNAETMRSLIRDVAVGYLALGLDPSRSVFYVQSDVPEVAELTWLLSTVTGMGLLERAHSYKDKVARGIAADVGLFTYPILMAADILGPQADIVPVGADQKQHIEMTRDMAGYFNNSTGPCSSFRRTGSLRHLVCRAPPSTSRVIFRSPCRSRAGIEREHGIGCVRLSPRSERPSRPASSRTRACRVPSWGR